MFTLELKVVNESGTLLARTKMLGLALYSDSTAVSGTGVQTGLSRKVRDVSTYDMMCIYDIITVTRCTD